MLGDSVLNRDLDEFTSAPELKSSILLRPSRTHRTVYITALFIAALLAITGIANLISVFSRAEHPASDTLTLGIGLVLLLAALTLAWRFAAPLAFAVAVTEEGLAWRSIFGWHAAPWDEIEFVLVEPHTAFGAREVHVKAGKQRMHYGWFDSTDWYTFGPLESLPADEAKSLTHTIVARAGLRRREAGVWVTPNADKPIEVSSGMLKW